MILTSEDFKKFGFKHVIEYDVPVMVICGEAVAARTFKYKKIEDMYNEPWFIDSLALQSPILLCKLQNSHPEFIMFRMFSKNIQE